MYNNTNREQQKNTSSLPCGRLTGDIEQSKYLIVSEILPDQHRSDDRDIYWTLYKQLLLTAASQGKEMNESKTTTRHTCGNVNIYSIAAL